MKAPDFEDCLLATCTKFFGCDMIVTRNGKDFNDFDVRIVESKDFMNAFLS